MVRWVTAILIAASLLAAPGCASVATAEKPFAGLPFRHKGFDFTQGWNATATPQGVAVDGVLKNTRYLKMEELSVAVSLIRGGKVVARGIFFVPDGVDNGQTCGFAVLLKGASVVTGDRIQFDVSYLGLEGSDAIPWTSSFTADAVSGKAIRHPEEMPSEE